MSHKPSSAFSSLSRADRLRLILGGSLVVLLLIGSALLWLCRDRFTSSAPPAAENVGSYSYEPAGSQRFACLGSRLLCVSTSGFELWDKDGRSLAAKVTALDRPALSLGEDRAAIYSLGGTDIHLLDSSGGVSILTTEGELLSAELSPTGRLAAVSRGTDCKGLVTVFDEQQREIYRWYAASVWPLTAELSPDGTVLAVLCCSDEGSEVRFFSLDSESQQAAFSVSGTVLLDLHWFSGTQLCALSAENLLFFSGDGRWSATYDFGGQHLCAWSEGGEGFVALALSPYRSGASATVVTLDAAGQTLGTAETDAQLLSLDARGSEVLVLSAGRAELFSSTLAEKGRADAVSGFQQALIRSKGEALLLASGFAEVYKF